MHPCFDTPHTNFLLNTNNRLQTNFPFPSSNYKGFPKKNTKIYFKINKCEIQIKYKNNNHHCFFFVVNLKLQTSMVSKIWNKIPTTLFPSFSSAVLQSFGYRRGGVNLEAIFFVLIRFITTWCIDSDCHNKLSVSII